LRLPFLVVCLGSLLGPLDGSVNVAFPSITQSFGLALGDIQWIVVSYILAQSALTLAFGRLGDLHGHRRVFLAGMVLAVVAFTANGFATSYPMLVATRALQGVAIGLALASGPALATLMYPESRKRTILAIYVSLTSIGGAIGPLIAGVLVDLTGWPGVFWFRAPLAALVLMLGFTLPAVNPQRSGHDARIRFDLAGLVLLATAITCLVFAITLARGPHGGFVPVVVLLACGAIAGTAFVRHEERTPAPMLRMQPFHDRTFVAMQLAAVAIHLASFAIFLLMPYVLAAHAGHSTLRTGLLLSVFASGAVGGGVADRMFVGRLAPKAVLVVGLVVSASGLALLAWAAGSASTSAIALAHLLTGAGLGLFSVGHMDATTSALPPAERGVAGSLVAVARMIGLVFGATVLTGIHAALGGAARGVPAFQGTFLAAGALVALAALMLGSSRRGGTAKLRE